MIRLSCPFNNKTPSDRLTNTPGNIKLDPLSALCISGLKGTSRYDFVVAAHSTGLTTLQVGQKIITVSGEN